MMDTFKRRIRIREVAIIADRNSSAPSIYDEIARKLSLSVNLALVTYERDILWCSPESDCDCYPVVHAWLHYSRLVEARLLPYQYVTTIPMSRRVGDRVCKLGLDSSKCDRGDEHVQVSACECIIGTIIPAVGECTPSLATPPNTWTQGPCFEGPSYINPSSHLSSHDPELDVYNLLALDAPSHRGLADLGFHVHHGRDMYCMLGRHALGASRATRPHRLSINMPSNSHKVPPPSWLLPFRSMTVLSLVSPQAFC